MFEHRQTAQYAIQEILRIERVSESAGIQDTLDAYNPRMPDGHNLKAAMLIAYDDSGQRPNPWARRRGIEPPIVPQVGHRATAAVVDEALEHCNEAPTSAVHFLRFVLDRAVRDAWSGGAPGARRGDRPAAERVIVPDPRPHPHRALTADFA